MILVTMQLLAERYVDQYSAFCLRRTRITRNPLEPNFVYVQEQFKRLWETGAISPETVNSIMGMAHIGQLEMPICIFCHQRCGPLAIEFNPDPNCIIEYDTTFQFCESCASAAVKIFADAQKVA